VMLSFLLPYRPPKMCGSSQGPIAGDIARSPVLWGEHSILKHQWIQSPSAL